MTSPSTINSPEKSLELQDSVVLSTSPISEEEDDTQNLHRLVKSLALDAQELRDRQELFQQGFQERMDRIMASLQATQENFERIWEGNAEIQKANISLTQSHAKIGEVVVLLSERLTKLIEKDKAATTARHIQSLQVAQSPFETKTDGKLILPLVQVPKTMN
jgi:hypothetical protein